VYRELFIRALIQLKGSTNADNFDVNYVEVGQPHQQRQRKSVFRELLRDGVILEREALAFTSQDATQKNVGEATTNVVIPRRYVLDKQNPMTHQEWQQKDGTWVDGGRLRDELLDDWGDNLRRRELRNTRSRKRAADKRARKMVKGWGKAAFGGAAAEAVRREGEPARVAAHLAHPHGTHFNALNRQWAVHSNNNHSANTMRGEYSGRSDGLVPCKYCNFTFADTELEARDRHERGHRLAHGAEDDSE
jgi:hypothetical protein